MIVRLKEFEKFLKGLFVETFQFYDSPIKSDKVEVRLDEIPWFQFYDSPIKRYLRAL